MQIWAVLICYVYVLCTVCAPDPDSCPCNDPTYDSEWGTFVPNSSCIGKCDGIITGKRRCTAVSTEDATLEDMWCNVVKKCALPNTCEGTWSTWVDFGRCNSDCEQLQARYCYKLNLETGTYNIRNEFCLGGEGNFEQHRRRPCSIKCSHLRPTMSSIPSTSSPDSFKTLPSTQQVTVHDSSHSKIETTVAGESGEDSSSRNYASTVSPQGGIGSVLLAVILGSAALLCIVIFAVAVFLHRKKRPRTDYPTFVVGSSRSDPHTIRNENYDAVITPTRPEQPPSHRAFLSSTQTQSLTNVLYQSLQDKEDTIPHNEDSVDGSGYLLPISPSIPPEEEQSVYCTIADTRR